MRLKKRPKRQETPTIGPSFGKEPDFAERLSAARERQGVRGRLDQRGLSAEKGEAEGAADKFKPWAMATQAGVEMVSALAVAVLIGWALDHWLHTAPLFLIIFLPLGGAAGVLNLWRRLISPRQGRK